MSAPGSKVVLVHGAWHGAWCWHKILPGLGAMGVVATALDLPGHGIDSTPPGSVTMDDYVGRLIAAIEAVGEPVTLVAHSLGGAAATALAEARPDLVARLVFVSAFMLAPGVSVQAFQTRPGNQSLVREIFRPKPEAGIVELATGRRREIFYAMSGDADVCLARSLLRPQPLRPIGTAVSQTASRAGTIPRVYIRCTQDRVVTPAMQADMLSETPCERVLEIEADHSPFFSAPETLTAQIAEIALNRSPR